MSEPDRPRAGGHQHRPGEVLGQARRRPEPARDRQPVADAGRAGHHDPRCASSRTAPAGRDAAAIACCCDGAPGRRRRSPARVSRFLDLVRARAGLRAAGRGRRPRTRSPPPPGWPRRPRASPRWRWPPAGPPGLQLSPAELSALARRGSGSAARSIFGGFVEMAAGHARRRQRRRRPPAARRRATGTLRLVVAVTATGPKAIGSTAAMDRTAATSPYYAGLAGLGARRSGRGPRRAGRPRPAPPGRGGRAQRPAHARLGHGRRAGHPLLVAGHAGGDAGGAPGPRTTPGCRRISPWTPDRT